MENNMDNVLAVILGGGQGTRLYPLTKYRSKPAVPIGGKFRLIDIPISICIHSNIRKIYVVTQFNTESLHRHIFNTYHFDRFSNGFLQILAAQQTIENTNWYEGTADAVRKNISYIKNLAVDYVIILSGDQLYRLNLLDFLDFHKCNNADISIASTPIPMETAGNFGILKIDKSRRITHFEEKPKKIEILDSLKIPDDVVGGEKQYPFLASMGIYIFNKNVLVKILESNSSEDFGKQIIPASIKTHNVYSYIFSGYWEDIGTIRSFFDANLDFANPVPKFNFCDELHPIYTKTRFLPGSKVKNCIINRALISEGSILEGSEISNSVIGIRSIIKEGSTLNHVIMMGADYYEKGKIMNNGGMGIGKNCFIKNAILDKNVRIGDNVVIDYKGAEKNLDAASYCIREGIVVITKNGCVPPNTRIE
jgi:glucose-1-phosphate adenylyltransferase